MRKPLPSKCRRQPSHSQWWRRRANGPGRIPWWLCRLSRARCGRFRVSRKSKKVCAFVRQTEALGVMLVRADQAPIHATAIGSDLGSVRSLASLDLGSSLGFSLIRGHTTIFDIVEKVIASRDFTD
jgi:hypothetical protein